MKKVLLVWVFISYCCIGSAQEINWISMTEALEAQKTEPRKIFMDVYTEWCTPCKILESNTFQNKDVANYINTHFYAVKFNAEGKEEIIYQGKKYTNPNYDPKKKGRNSVHIFTRAMNVTGYPSMSFFDEKGMYIESIVGYHSPEQLEIYLKLMHQDDYKNLTTKEAWEEYQANFRGTFKS